MTDVVVQHTSGGTGVPLDTRIESLRTEPPPERASLDMGPVNRYHHLTSDDTRGMVDALVAEMDDRGIKPEMEAFDPGHLNEVHALLDRADIDDPPYVNLILRRRHAHDPPPAKPAQHGG